MHQAIIFFAVNPHLRISERYCTQSVCVCVCPPVFSVAARALSVKRGHVGTEVVCVLATARIWRAVDQRSDRNGSF